MARRYHSAAPVAPGHARRLYAQTDAARLGADVQPAHHVAAARIRAARNNGVTPEEIKDVLLQAAIYCGVPAANHAFALAKPILEEQASER